ncbi:MAG: CPBP family intramembrane metalloprotease [bacterium]|nr:CPBP family intramembrane metalloprotease [bacterium]
MATEAIFGAMRESRVFSDLTAYDRDARRLAVAVPVGVLAAAAAAVLGGASACLLVMVVVSGLDGAAAAAGLFAALDQPALAATDGQVSLFILAILAGVNGAAAVGFVAVSAGLSHRPIRRYIGAEPGFRARLLIAGLVLVGALMAALVLIPSSLGAATPTPPLLALESTGVGRATYVAFAVVLLVLAAAAEELVFRGWLLKQTGAFTRHPAVLMAVNGLIFATIHFDPNLDAFLFRAAMGAGLTWMTLRTGGIELAIGAHAANNIVILLLLQPLSLQPETPHGFQASSLAAGLAVGLGYAALAEVVVRWPIATRWLGRRDPATV